MAVLALSLAAPGASADGYVVDLGGQVYIYSGQGPLVHGGHPHRGATGGLYNARPGPDLIPRLHIRPQRHVDEARRNAEGRRHPLQTFPHAEPNRYLHRNYDGTPYHYPYIPDRGYHGYSGYGRDPGYRYRSPSIHNLGPPSKRLHR